MKILFTLDYELFLGARTGTVGKCLIEPMSAYIKATERYGVKFTLFVDAAFLLKLQELSYVHPHLRDEQKRIHEHLRILKDGGHDIQLHIHPQWIYSTYNGSDWEMDTTHYKLSDLTPDNALWLFKSAKRLLESIIGTSVIAFRAGGFSAQPTSLLVELFQNCGITVDSSVCPGTRYISDQQFYDYRNVMTHSEYRFDSDLCQPTTNGMGFLELPIYTYRLTPLFYGQYVVTRLLKQPKHRTLGDGISVEATRGSIVTRLTRPSYGLATIDGFKINYLYRSYLKAHRDREHTFVIIGHPKLATPYSLKKIETFCRHISKEDEILTVNEYWTGRKME